LERYEEAYALSETVPAFLRIEVIRRETRQTIVAKVEKKAVLPQWFAACPEKRRDTSPFLGKKCQFSDGKALLLKSDKRQTIVATYLYKAELFKLNSRQTFRAMAAMHTDESQRSA